MSPWLDIGTSNGWSPLRRSPPGCSHSPGAADRIGREYFGGRSPLLPDSADNLTALVAQLEGMIEQYNDRFEEEERPRKRGGKGKALTPIDLEALRERASDGAAALFQELVTTAKTEALLMIGERKQAFSLMGQALDAG